MVPIGVIGAFGIGLGVAWLGLAAPRAEPPAESTSESPTGPPAESTVAQASESTDRAQAGRKLVDEYGVEFALPLDWPEALPIPTRLDNCVRCHIDKGGAISAAVLDYAGSAHDVSLNSCVSCHGGDPINDARAHEVDFLSGYRQLMARCNECHPQGGDFFLQSAHYSERPRWDLPNCSNCHDNHSTGKGNFRQSNACNECHGTKSQMATGAGETRLIWKSRKAGSAGNRISIRMSASAANQELGAYLRREANREFVEIELATNAQGQPVSLAMDVVDAATANSDLYYLVSVEEADDALGEGVVDPHDAKALEGGAGYETTYPQYKDLVDANDRFREILSQLRREPESISYSLGKRINYIQWETMILLHEVATEPDAEMMKVTIEETGKVIVELKEALAEWQGKAQEAK